MFLLAAPARPLFLSSLAYSSAKMGLLNNSLASLLLLAPLVLGHPGPEEHVNQPLESRNLDHCQRDFSEPEFVKRTIQIHGAEYARLRRSLGLEAPDPYDIPS